MKSPSINIANIGGKQQILTFIQEENPQYKERKDSYVAILEKEAASSFSISRKIQVELPNNKKFKNDPII